MFKPLYERKNAVKTPFSSLKIQKKTIQGESGFFALFAIWEKPGFRIALPRQTSSFVGVKALSVV
jgi:hypothetical protein